MAGLIEKELYKIPVKLVKIATKTSVPSASPTAKHLFHFFDKSKVHLIFPYASQTVSQQPLSDVCKYFASRHAEIKGYAQPRTICVIVPFKTPQVLHEMQKFSKELGEEICLAADEDGALTAVFRKALAEEAIIMDGKLASIKNKPTFLFFLKMYGRFLVYGALIGYVLRCLLITYTIGKNFA